MRARRIKSVINEHGAVVTDEYWREYDECPFDDEEDWEYLPKGADKICRECPDSKMAYHIYDGPGYTHRYKSSMCLPGKALICLNGFIKKEEFNV